MKGEVSGLGYYLQTHFTRLSNEKKLREQKDAKILDMAMEKKRKMEEAKKTGIQWEPKKGCLRLNRNVNRNWRMFQSGAKHF